MFGLSALVPSRIVTLCVMPPFSLLITPVRLSMSILLLIILILVPVSRLSQLAFLFIFLENFLANFSLGLWSTLIVFLGSFPSRVLVGNHVFDEEFDPI